MSSPQYFVVREQPIGSGLVDEDVSGPWKYSEAEALADAVSNRTLKTPCDGPRFRVDRLETLAGLRTVRFPVYYAATPWSAGYLADVG